ncbi:MAG: hypothetical protein ACR2MX_10385 [Cyclobacteriaceae bacterium]
MGGEGSMSMMNLSLKNNRALLRKKWGTTERKEYANYAAKNKTILTFKKATTEDLLKIRKQLKRQRRFSRLKRVAALVFSITVTSYALYALIQLS